MISIIPNLDTIKEILLQAKMPTDNAAMVLELVISGEITIDELISYIPKIQEDDLQYGINNNGNHTITEENVIAAKRSDFFASYPEHQIEGRASIHRNNNNKFAETLTLWINRDAKTIVEKSYISPEQLFIDRYNLNINAEELKQLANGELAPNNTILHKLLSVFNDNGHKKIGYATQFAENAQKSMERLPILKNRNENSHEIIAFGKKLNIFLAICGIPKNKFPSFFGCSERAIINWSNGIGLSASRIEKMSDIFSQKLPNFDEHERDEFFASARQYLPQPYNAENFSAALLGWREICELTPKEFCSEISIRMNKEPAYHESYFSNWRNGKQLSVKLLDCIADFLEEKTSSIKDPKLHFNKENREKFYALADKNFPPKNDKNFSIFITSWQKRTGHSLNYLLANIGAMVKEDKTAFSIGMFYNWQKGHAITEELLYAICKFFSEETKSYKSDLFRFTDEDAEKLIKLAKTAEESKPKRKRYDKKPNSSFAEMVSTISSPQLVQRQAQ